jgi:hypothetical protein
MLLLYKNAASMPDFILAMEEVQKKAKHAELPILNIQLAMYAATLVLHAEILGDSYSKKSPLPSIGNFPCLANSPKLSSYQVLGQSRI